MSWSGWRVRSHDPGIQGGGVIHKMRVLIKEILIPAVDDVNPALPIIRNAP